MSPLFLVIQEGGSSCEFYASLYETEAEAQKACDHHEESSYRTIGPLALSENLSEALASREGGEGEFLEAVESIATNTAELILRTLF